MISYKDGMLEGRDNSQILPKLSTRVVNPTTVDSEDKVCAS